MRDHEMCTRAHRILATIAHLQTGANVHECLNMRMAIVSTMDVYEKTGDPRWKEQFQKALNSADRTLSDWVTMRFQKKNEKSP